MENNFSRPYVPWKDYSSKVNQRPGQNKPPTPQNKKEDFVIPPPNSFGLPVSKGQISSTQMKSRVIKFNDSFEDNENESELRQNNKNSGTSLHNFEKASGGRKTSSNSRSGYNDNQNNPLRPEMNHYATKPSQGKSSRPNSNNHYGYKPDSYPPRSTQNHIPPEKNNNQAIDINNWLTSQEYLNEMIDTAAPYTNKKLPKDFSRDKVQSYYQQGSKKDNRNYSDKPFRQASPAYQDAKKGNIGLLDEMFEQHERISSNNHKKPSTGGPMNRGGFEERKIEPNYDNKRNNRREEYWPDEEEVLRIAFEKQALEDKKAKAKKENAPETEDIWVKCSYCDMSVPIDVLSVHELECDKKEIPCEKCGKRILMDIYDFHVNSECKKRHPHRHRSHNHNPHHHHHHYNPAGYSGHNEFDAPFYQIEFNSRPGIIIGSNRANRRINGDDLGTYEELLALDDNKVQVGMSESELNRLESKTYIASNGGPKECHVCLTDFESGDKLRKLKCKHEFHQDCIDTWLKNNITCPVCKTYTK